MNLCLDQLYWLLPVTNPMYYSVDSHPLENVDKVRRVYLPDGADWIDFWTGKKYKGGQWIVAEATINKIPLLVRQGSIIPMGPVMQYTLGKNRCRVGDTGLSWEPILHLRSMKMKATITIMRRGTLQVLK